MGKYSGKPTAVEVVAGFLRRQGVDISPLRLQETAAAERERNRREFAEYSDFVKAKVTQVKRATRQVEIDEYCWRRSPNQDSLQRAQAAQRSRQIAEAELLEALNGDKALVRAALRQV